MVIDVFNKVVVFLLCLSVLNVLRHTFFLITNDTKFPNNQKTIESLQKILQENSKIGILSPCSEKWGEKSASHLG